MPFWHELSLDERKRLKLVGDVAFRLASCDCGTIPGLLAPTHTRRCAKAKASDAAQDAAEREMDEARARQRKDDRAVVRRWQTAGRLPR